MGAIRNMRVIRITGDMEGFKGGDLIRVKEGGREEDHRVGVEG